MKVTYQIFWEAAKTFLRGMFIMINAYINKEERSQINNNFTTQELEKKNILSSKLSEGRR